MRFVHFSDTHLGYSEFGKIDPTSGVNIREQDVYNAFDDAIDQILSLAPDFVIHSGDLFNSPRPSNRAITKAGTGLKKLTDAGIPTVIVAGNHEVPRVAATGSIFELLPLLGVESVYHPEYHVSHFGDTAVHCVPHLPTPEDLQTVLAGVAPDSKVQFNILVLHCAVRGTGERYSLSEFNELVLNHDQLIGLSGFDYIALGHYHKHLKVAPNAFYCGSTERFSFREIGYLKGLLEVNLGTGKQKFHPINCRQMISPKAIACQGQAASAIMGQIKGALSKAQPLANAIVRLELLEIDPAVWFEIDQKQIREWATDALELRIEKTVAEKGGTANSGQVRLGGLVAEFASFIKSAPLKGLDRNRLRKLGEGYLADIDEEAAE